jgi:tRNA uridine 5-carboxymethylaminomethyl modification enzyme
MIDDLVTKGVGGEPYRMFTSRAEHRLVLREDNADFRLAEIGREVGLVDDAALAATATKRQQVAAEVERFETTVVQPGENVAAALAARGSTPIRVATSLVALLKRPELSFDDVLSVAGITSAATPDVGQQVEISVKYGGYVSRQERAIERSRRLDDVRLPPGVDYAAIHGLSHEVREKLETVRPRTLGQASRIAGVTPAALSLLAIHLRRSGDA